MGILDFFPPGMTPREGQRDILLAVEAAWHKSDIFVITAPVGAGKSAIAATIAEWRRAAGQTNSLIVPNNLLLDQYARSFPRLPMIRRRRLYQCTQMGNSCADQEICCRGVCPYTKAKRLTKAAGVRAATYHGYVAHRMHSDVLIADEAHRLVELLRATGDVTIRRSKFTFPDTLVTQEDLISWLQYEMRRRDDPALKKVLADVQRINLAGALEFKDVHTGKKFDRHLTLRAVTGASAGRLLWPSSVRKIVLMSATIGAKDVDEMGLGMRRATYLTCASPIDPLKRPIRYEPTANMALKYRQFSAPLLATKIGELLGRYPDKGLVHVPYDVAKLLRLHLSDSRLLWHDKKDKSAVFNEFLASPPEQGKVLVASGMYEGIDLPYDAARWQVIGVVPFLPLGEKWVRERADKDPEWYAWSAVKQVAQASGRVVRSEDDYGVTVITDTQFERVHRNHRQLFPKFFIEAMIGA